MLDLVSRIEMALEDASTPPWLFHLAEELAGTGWEPLGRAIGLTPVNYGTVRVICRDADASREIVTYVPELFDAHDAGRRIAVELLPEELAWGNEDAGATFYRAEEIGNTEVLSCVEEAMSVLESIPTLATTVTALVRSLHLLKPEDDDYDVSFSKPDIPFSIFVSVPRRRIPADAIRVAEAIVHEAMHLQLTLIERLLPLVYQSRRKYFSPWRGEHRTAQGVLHALHVFRVIDSFFSELMSRQSCAAAWTGFAQERCKQIRRQINEMSAFHECRDLTLHGIHLVRRLLA